MSTSPTLFSGAAAGTHCEYLPPLCTTKGNGRNAVWPGHHTRAEELMETQFSLLVVAARQLPHSLHHETYLKTAISSSPASQVLNY